MKTSGTRLMVFLSESLLRARASAWASASAAAIPATTDAVKDSARGEPDEQPIRAELESSVRWNRTTLAALFALVALWALKVYTTWGAWGNLTIDSGHEMYVPWLLAQGKMLYRDVWFLYTPAAPYFNSYLFRLFGAHLEVLYWAGSLAALGSAIFLYLTGMRLSSWIIGWTAGTVVIAQAFQPSLFCFPLPYSFSAVYGCLVGCVFLWLAVNAMMAKGPGWHWMLGAGTAAGVALLLKPEFGTACYATLILLIAVRGFLRRSWRSIGTDAVAILPGIILCALVIRWMVSIAGSQFITQENIMSWPTSFFMKRYGKLWLESNGFTVSLEAFRSAAVRALPLAGLAVVLYRVRTLWLRLLAIAIILIWVFAWNYWTLPDAPRLGIHSDVLRAGIASWSHVAFPLDMVLYVSLGAVWAWSYFWRQRHASSTAERSAAIALAFSFSAALGFRILMNTTPAGYSIYYNGPVVLSFLLLASPIVLRQLPTRGIRLLGVLAICLMCLGFVAVRSRLWEEPADHFVPFRTERGTIRVPERMARNYRMAINFMKEKAARGETVLCVPEDTSLYFLSGTYCPTRVFAFCPGVLAPGKMTDETIREVEQKPVGYLLWSNRTFVEYGVPIFGHDFDRPFGDYLRSHYRRVGFLNPQDISVYEWTVTIWQRLPAEAKTMPGEAGKD
ncbi:MAG TPA: hypothetical protein VOA41_01435 [Candidatus Dormibacteraeota bacterium]|nr:hypothetical protein [Candidatus Dormibacteraeota bacterium]